jgi:hypothetical protein
MESLFGKQPGIDPDFDLVMNESLAKNEYPEEMLDAARSSGKASLGETGSMSLEHLMIWYSRS